MTFSVLVLFVDTVITKICQSVHEPLSSSTLPYQLWWPWPYFKVTGIGKKKKMHLYELPCCKATSDRKVKLHISFVGSGSVKFYFCVIVKCINKTTANCFSWVCCIKGESLYIKTFHVQKHVLFLRDYT